MSFLYPVKFAVHALFCNINDYRKRSNEFSLKYYSSKDLPIKTQNEIICTFDGSMHHGGLGDRLRGITSVYEYCKRNNRIFKINFFDPFKLETFLLPNKYDWRIDRKLISQNINAAQPVIFDCDLNFFEHYIHRYTMKTMFKKDKQIHVYTNTFCYDKSYAENFHELFKPSPLLQSTIDKQLHIINGEYITVSFRFCQLLGNFNQDVFRPLPEEQQISLIERSKQVLYKLKKRHSECSKIVVTSDSTNFINAIHEIPFVYIIPGNITHSNYKATDESHLKTFLDFYIIANAKKVYMARTKIMYKSGFAFRAAQINNVPFEEYHYE